MNGQAYTRFSQYYDAMMHDVDYSAWAEYLCGLLDQYGARTVADVACGTGNITLPLKEHGYLVTGIDRSESMLNVAQQKAREKGLHIPFACQSMTDLQFHRPVDAITVCCDGVNYLTSDLEADSFFHAAYAALTESGKLLFDISSVYKLEHVLGCQTFTEVSDSYAYIWENAFDPKQHLSQMDICFFVRDGHMYERFSERHLQRAFSVEELRCFGQRAGFNNIQAWEAFSRKAPSPQSQRIQFVMGKD